MAKFYIQLENRLLQISGELTAENISKALGYVPVSPNVTNELSQRVDNITFDSLKDNPFLQDGSGELNIVDETGNIIAKIDAEGIHSVDFITGEHRLSNKTDKIYVDEAIKNVKVDLTGYATEEYVNNIDFYNINNNPIVNNGDGKLLFVDENGYIGLQLEEDGLYVKDVIADGHTLSQKADKSDIPSLEGYATETYVNTNLQNYATKDEVSDLVDMSIVNELQEKVNTLIDTDNDKSVRDIAVDVLTETLVSETATEAYDTLAEMSAWIKSHPEDAAAMNTAIQKNATDITNLDAAYKAADVKVLTDAQEYTDNINFYTIKDNPIVDNNDGNLTFVDESGNIGLQLEADNTLYVKDVIAGDNILSNKVDKSELPTKISELENDKGYITSTDIPEIPSLDEYVKSEDLPNFEEFAKTTDIPSLEGYAKLEDIPEVPEIPSLDEYITEDELSQKGYLTSHQDISHLATKNEVSESIADIDFYDIQNNPVVNTEEGKLLFVDETGNIGLQLEGDVLYVKDVIAGNDTLSNKADKSYVDNSIANLIDSAPETLNTLNELAIAIQENEDVVEVLNQSIGSKQDTITDLETIRQGAAKGATALQTEQYKGTIQAVDTSETLDDVETNTYVKYVAQSLTDAQKQQVKQNLGISENTDLSETYIYDISKSVINAGIGSINGIKLWTDSNSGKNPTNFTFKTVNGESLLGEGDIIIEGNNTVDWEDIQNKPNVIFDIPNEKNPVCIGYDRLTFPDNGKLTSTAPLGNFTLGWTNGISWQSFNGDDIINHEITAKGDGTKLLSDDGEYKKFKTINGTSILGSGDITIQSGGGSGAYALVEHGNNDTTFTLTPNTFHVWDEVANLTLTLGSKTTGVANEYLFQFTSGTTATTLSLPSDLKWANDSALTIEPNMIYQVSILNGLATVLEFNNTEPLIENKLSVTTSNRTIIITSQYPVTSDVQISIVGIYDFLTESLTMQKGSNRIEKLGNDPDWEMGAIITKIIPSYDDTYLYIF